VGKMEIVVEIDSKGRPVIPSKIRHGPASKRMILRKAEDHLELIPLPIPRSLKGKYMIDGKIEDKQKLLERGLSPTLIYSSHT